MREFASISCTASGYLERYQKVQVNTGFQWAASFLAGKKVLDLGCGNGEYLARLGPGCVGVDVSFRNVAICQQRGLLVRQLDVNRGLDIFEDAAFEAVLCAHLLEHLDSPIRALREINRVIAPGGVVVIGLPVEGGLSRTGRSYYRKHEGHLQSFSLENLLHLLRLTGFRTMAWYYELPLLDRLARGKLLPPLQRLPAWMLSRVAKGLWVAARKEAKPRAPFVNNGHTEA